MPTVSPRAIRQSDLALSAWTRDGNAASIAQRPLAQFRSAVLSGIRWRNADAALLLLDWRHCRLGLQMREADLCLLADALSAKFSNAQVDTCVDAAHRVISIAKDEGVVVGPRLAGGIVRLIAGAPPTRAIARQLGCFSGDLLDDRHYVKSLRRAARGEGTADDPPPRKHSAAVLSGSSLRESAEIASAGGHFGTNMIAKSSRMTKQVRQSLRAAAAFQFLQAWTSKTTGEASTDEASTDEASTDEASTDEASTDEASTATGIEQKSPPRAPDDGKPVEPTSQGRGSQSGGSPKRARAAKVRAAREVVAELGGPLLSASEALALVRRLAGNEHGAALTGEAVRAATVNGELSTAHRLLAALCEVHQEQVQEGRVGQGGGLVFSGGQTLPEAWFTGLLQRWCWRGDVDGACSTLRLMRRHRVKPGHRSLHALSELYLRVSEGHRGEGSATVVAELAAAIGVRPAPRTIGGAAFYAGKHRNWREVQRLEQLGKAARAADRAATATDEIPSREEASGTAEERSEAGTEFESSWFRRLGQLYREGVKEDQAIAGRRAQARGRL